VPSGILCTTMPGVIFMCQYHPVFLTSTHMHIIYKQITKIKLTLYVKSHTVTKLVCISLNANKMTKSDIYILQSSSFAWRLSSAMRQ